MKLLKKLVVLVLLVLVTTGCVGNATSYRITFRTNGGSEIAQAEVQFQLNLKTLLKKVMNLLVGIKMLN